MHAYSIREEYEAITDKALTTPINTHHLMELKEFMQKAEEKDLIELEEKMVEAKHRSILYSYGVQLYHRSYRWKQVSLYRGIDNLVQLGGLKVLSGCVHSTQSMPSRGLGFSLNCFDVVFAFCII